MFCLVLHHISTYFHRRKLDTSLNDLQGAPNHTYPSEPNLLRSIACRAGIIQQVSVQYFLTKIIVAINDCEPLTLACPNKIPPPQAIRSTFDLAISPMWVGKLFHI